MYKLQVCIYISVVNFDGFHDDESGIYRYMWAVGTAVCRNNTVDFQDPHEFLHSAKHWTHNGYSKNLQLAVSAIDAVKCKYMHECMLCSANDAMNNIRSILQCPCEVLYGQSSSISWHSSKLIIQYLRNTWCYQVLSDMMYIQCRGSNAQ